MTANKSTAWILLALTWIATPFLNDRTPTIFTALYVVLLACGFLYGIYTAWRTKSWLLGIASALTAFAWPIMLFVILRFFGI